MAEKQTKKQLEQQIKILQQQNIILEQQLELLKQETDTQQDIHPGANSQQYQFLQKVLETFPYPAYFRDKHGRFQAGNEAWINIIVGLPLAEIVNKTMPQLPDQAKNSFLGKNNEQDWELMQSGQSMTTYEKVYCPDAVLRDFFIQKSVVKDENDKALGTIGLMVDKSELNFAQLSSNKDTKNMENNQNVLQDILYSLPYGIMIVDAETYTILDANPQTMVLVEKSLDQIVGQPLHAFIKNDDLKENTKPPQEETLFCDETSLVTAKNQRIPILRTVLKTTIAERTCLVESFIDITESKKAEALRTDQERMKSMFELAGAVCHELNQPLMIISGFAELLVDEINNDDPMYENIHRISAQIERMGNITKKLMSITKYETKDYLEGKIIDINSAAA